MRQWTGIVRSAVLFAAVVGGVVLAAAPVTIPPQPQPGAIPPKGGLPVEPPPTTVKQMLTATRMNFQCKNKTPDQALELLEQQIGYSLRPPAEEGAQLGHGKINIDDQNQSLLSVIQHICQQGDLVISRSASRVESSIVVNSRAMEGSDCFYPKLNDSSIMPIVSRLSTTSFRNEGRRLNVTISFVTEPKVYVIGYYRGNYLDSATDDQNRNLLPPPNAPGIGMMRVMGSGFQTADGVNIYTSINYPTAPAVAVKRLRGSVKVMLGLNVTPRDLSSALKGGETASLPFLKNNNIIFSDFDIDTKDPHGYVMTMSVPRIQLPGGMMVEQSPDLQRLHFEAIDGENKKWRVRKSGPRITDPKIAKFTINLHPLAEDGLEDKRYKPPVKFSVLIPAKTEDVTIPFEFNDLPVPAVPK